MQPHDSPWYCPLHMNASQRWAWICVTQTARWSESPDDMKRFGLSEGRVLGALVFDQDALNDLLISTSIGVSVAPLAMRGSNMSSIAGVSGGRGAALGDRKPVCLRRVCVSYTMHNWLLRCLTAAV